MNKPAQSSEHCSSKKWIAFSLVLTLVFFGFAPDLKNGLLNWDDSGYIYNNINIRSLSFDTIIWAFTDFYCNYWAPLTWLSLALDYAIWGTNPVGYHFTNNLIHALNSGIFLLITHSLLTTYATNKTDPDNTNSRFILITSIIASLFFGIHPLRVESVAWATERKDVLSVFWGLWSVLLYLKYVEKSTIKDQELPYYKLPSYWLMLLLYTLSLFSKSMLITLPFVLLVLDWFPLKRLTKRSFQTLFLEKLPLLILAIGTAIITMRALAVTSKSLSEIDFTTRLLTAFKSLIRYLMLLIYPADISPVYFHPGKASLDAGSLLSISAVTVITVACIVTVKRRQLYLAAWLIFLITIFPVLGLTQNGPQEMAPRFTYFPTLSLSLLIALGITTLWFRLPAVKSRPILLGMFVTLLLAALWAVTVRDIGFWKDDLTLWSRVIDLQPHQFGKAYYQRSLFLDIAGRYEEALADADEALKIAARKGYSGIHENYLNRGVILSKMGRYSEALADISKAIDLSGEPFNASYYYERASVYRKIGNTKAAEEDSAAAMARGYQR